MLNKKILICDDDDGILDMLEIMLESSGYETIGESNSLNISKVIEMHQPDLLILDLWMPVVSGDQVLKSLRKDPKTKSLPVIVISASRDGQQIASNAGADAFMAKPFDIDHLLDKISTYIH